MFDHLRDTHKNLNNRIKPSLVLLWYCLSDSLDLELTWIGSGFFANYKNAKFIFSCEHVISEFMSAKHAYIVKQVDSSKIERLQITSWKGLKDPYDVAYLRLTPNSISDLICIQEGDIDANPTDWDRFASLVYGYPGRLAKIQDDGKEQEFQGFSFIGNWQKKDSDGIRDLFDYPKTDDVIMHGVNKMPEPKGISGSPIWKFEITPNRTSDNMKAKVVAIQNAWIPSKRVYVGTPIKHLIELIEKNEILS